MEPVATIILIGPRAGQSISYPTTPGKQVAFHGGAARIFDEREMPTVLRRADVEVAPAPRYLDFLPAWMNQCGESAPPQARLSLPEGLEIAGTPTHYALRVREYHDEPDAEPTRMGWDPAEPAICGICEQPFQRTVAHDRLAPQKYCGAECRNEAARQASARQYEKRKAAKLAALLAETAPEPEPDELERPTAAVG